MTVVPIIVGVTVLLCLIISLLLCLAIISGLLGRMTAVALGVPRVDA
jgi:hypothetical protein